MISSSKSHEIDKDKIENIIKEFLPPNRVEIFFSEDKALRRFATVRFCGNLGGLSINNNE